MIIINNNFITVITLIVINDIFSVNNIDFFINTFIITHTF